MTVPQIVRENTGMGFKEAVRYYASMSMSKSMAAREVGIPLTTFHRYLTQFKLHGLFPRRSKMRHECRGKGTPRKGSGNRLRVRLYARQPIVHNGLVWYPGEPTHHRLFEERKR